MDTDGGQRHLGIWDDSEEFERKAQPLILLDTTAYLKILDRYEEMIWTTKQV